MGKKKLFFKFFLCVGILFSNEVLSQEIELQEDAPVVQKVIFDTPEINYTWADFLIGESCRDDFALLSGLPFLTPEQEKLKNEMTTYCLSSVSVWDDLKKIFRQNKKSLLLNQNAKEEWFVIRYVKMIPIYLWDIHNANPRGHTLQDKLDKIQNAIDNKKLEKVLALMQDLSPSQQLFFMPLFNEITQLLDFKQDLGKGEK